MSKLKPEKQEILRLIESFNIPNMIEGGDYTMTVHQIKQSVRICLKEKETTALNSTPTHRHYRIKMYYEKLREELEKEKIL
jgi:hypothetical protein